MLYFTYYVQCFVVSPGSLDIGDGLVGAGGRTLQLDYPEFENCHHLLPFLVLVKIG